LRRRSGLVGIRNHLRPIDDYYYDDDDDDDDDDIGQK
jgi:hypothetical protein